MIPRRTFALATVLILAVVACSEPSGHDAVTTPEPDPATAETTTTTSVLEDQSLVEAQQVVLTPSLNDETSSRIEIGPEGGVVSATDSRGTVYQLSIPAGSVTETTEITMAPLEGLDGVEGFIAGVELFPDGLVLQKPALLSFAAPGVHRIVGWASANGYAWDHPYSVEGEMTQVPLFGFSGYAAISTPGGNAVECGDVGPTDDLRAAVSSAAIGLATGDSDWDPTANVDSIAWLYDCEAKPLLLKAQSDEQVFEVAGRAYLRFKGIAELVGLDDRSDIAARIAEGNGLATSALEFALDAANSRCYQNVDRTEAIQISRLGGWAIFFEAADHPSVGTQAIVERLRRCLSFELDISLIDHLDVDGVFVIDETVAAVVPFTFDDALALSGVAPAEFTASGYERGVEILEMLAEELGPMVGVEVPNDITTTDHFDCPIAPAYGEASIGGTVTDLVTASPTFAVTVAISENPAIVGPCTAPGAEPLPPFEVPSLMMEMLPDFFPDLYGSGALELTDWTPGSGAVVATTSANANFSEPGATVTASLDATIQHAPKP